MIPAKYTSAIRKWFFSGAICIVLLVCLPQVKSTVCYISSFSATCVNTFTGEGPIAPDPTAPQEPTPATGETVRLGWYIASALLGLAGMAVAVRVQYKGYLKERKK